MKTIKDFKKEYYDRLIFSNRLFVDNIGDNTECVYNYVINDTNKNGVFVSSKYSVILKYKVFQLWVTVEFDLVRTKPRKFTEDEIKCIARNVYEEEKKSELDNVSHVDIVIIGQRCTVKDLICDNCFNKMEWNWLMKQGMNTVLDVHIYNKHDSSGVKYQDWTIKNKKTGDSIQFQMFE